MFKIFKSLFIGTLVTLGVFSVVGTVSAQTISQTSGTTTISGLGIGQTFTATVTGTVTQIQVRPISNRFTSVYFYNGEGSPTVNSSAGSVFPFQNINLIGTGSPNSGLSTVVLNTPLPVIAGQKYSFAFTNPLDLAIDPTQPYVGGTTIVNYKTPSSSDLVFTVTEVATAQSVPTLAEWAMILLGVALAAMATLSLQRRRWASDRSLIG